MRNNICILIILFILGNSIALLSQDDDMVLIDGGTYIPLYGVDSSEVEVVDFYMDVYPVSNQDYIDYLRDHPEWTKSKVIKLFADDNYLLQWEDDLELDSSILLNAAVTNVSWFAAKEYCESLEKRLPMIDEWEYVAMADKTMKDARRKETYNQQILDWYEAPNRFLNPIGSTFKNYWGVYDMHGLVWEWTLDFNSVLISGESRKDVDTDNNLFCGSAAIGASDLMNYAAFMRYAFRGSMKARYASKNLGFRCVKTIEEQ